MSKKGRTGDSEAFSVQIFPSKPFSFILAEALKTFCACRDKVLQASQGPSCAMHVPVGGWTSALHPHTLALWLPCLCCQAALGNFTAIYLRERSIKPVFSGHPA